MGPAAGTRQPNIALVRYIRPGCRYTSALGGGAEPEPRQPPRPACGARLSKPTGSGPQGPPQAPCRVPLASGWASCRAVHVLGPPREARRAGACLVRLGLVCLKRPGMPQAVPCGWPHPSGTAKRHAPRPDAGIPGTPNAVVGCIRLLYPQLRVFDRRRMGYADTHSYPQLRVFDRPNTDWSAAC